MILFHRRAWRDYLEWIDLDPGALERLNRLTEECRRTRFAGTGRPEPLRGNWSGFWSRRIDQKHRIIYRMNDGTLEIAQCRYHYDDR